LRERYGDNPSTHPDFDLDLWMEVGSSGALDKNRSTGSPTLRPKTGSSPSVSSNQSEEFMALKQQYE